ncbi:MAG TPA: sulfatase-like hydrolase/transferase, partial [Minicystis sp.]|nr:sulfatase-like hydrolase/transferase [Minicystis sp.]
THVSVSVLWSGLPPTASKRAVERAPYLWDYARAAGYDVAYWTSQNLIFGNMRLAVEDERFTRYVSGTELDPYADPISGAPDAALADRVIAEIDGLHEPFYAVVQFSNIHRPRVFDPKFAPFQPTDTESKGHKDTAQRNYYKNVVYLSDLSVARVVEHVRKSAFGPRTVIVYTSDHGESYFEHHQDNDHSGSVYDDEIRVPAWIDAPDGTLADDERRAVRAKASAFLTHLDVAPTILDLLGLWGAPELAAFEERMPGHPITRMPLTVDPVPLSNVSWVWEYLVPNWGMIQGSLKVEALEKDEAWRCFDVARDPREKHELPATSTQCARLAHAADATFHMLPKALGRLRHHPDWGDGLGEAP